MPAEITTCALDVYRSTVSEDVATIDVRIIAGELRVGSRFRRGFRTLSDWEAGRSESFGPMIVERIEAYRHQFESLTAGMTARVTLRGSEGDVIGRMAFVGE